MKAGGLLARLGEMPERRFDLALFSLALALRAAFLAVFLARGLNAVYGQDLYYTLALSWLGWEPAWAVDVTHPPFYTWVIAAVMGVTRTRDPWPVLVLQTLASAATPVLLRRLAGRLVPEPVARLAAVWTALDPGLVFFTPHLQTETLYVFMQTCFFVWLYGLSAGPERRSWEWYGLGFLGGLSSLCRSVFAAYPAVLGPVLLWRLGWRAALPAFLLFSLGWLSPIGGWTGRNWSKYRQVIPISAQMGWTLYEGFTLDRDEVRRRPWDMDAEATRLGIQDPIERGKHFKEKTLRLVAADPAGALKIVLGKALLYWRPFPYDPHTGLQRLVIGVYYLLLFGLGAFGAWRTRGADWLPVYGLFGYLTAMHAVFFTSLRYRMPLEPFLCLFAAAGLAALMERGQARREAR